MTSFSPNHTINTKLNLQIEGLGFFGIPFMLHSCSNLLGIEASAYKPLKVSLLQVSTERLRKSN